VDEFGSALDEFRYDRGLIERQVRLAHAHGLTVVAGAYLPRPPSTNGAATRGKPRKPRTPKAA
jgi:hypothetical protein